VTLATFKIPELKFDFSLPFATDLLGIEGLGLNGQIHVDLKASVGYDTAGLLLYQSDPNKKSKDYLHGFYFDELNTVTTLGGSLTLGISSGCAGVRAEGGIYADATIRPGGVPDPTEPNKRRLDDFLKVDDDCLYRATGKIYAQASVSVFAGPITLFSFDLAYKELA